MNGNTPKKSPSNVLVTGATGLVGSYLVRYLLRKTGDNIIALRRSNSDCSLLSEVSDRIEFREADLNDYESLSEALNGVNKVFHCAALVSFDPRDKDLLLKTNVEGTANLVNICLESNIEKLVYVSSIAAIGKPPGRMSDENDYWQSESDSNFYSLSKFLSEQEVWRAEAEGLNVVIVNPTIILGSGFWDVGSNKFFQQAYKNFKFYTGGSTGFVDVRDVVRAMYILMENNISAQRYILNAEVVKFREMMNMVADAIGKKRPTTAVGKFLSGLIWRTEAIRGILTGAKPLITKATAKNANSDLSVDNSKSLNIPGFSYRPITTSIAEIGEQFRKASINNWKPDILPFDQD